MAEPYNLRTFIWKASIPDLLRFFQLKEFPHACSIDDDEAETRTKLFQLIADLPYKGREPLERDFRDIYGLAHQRGIEVAVRVAVRRSEGPATIEELRTLLGSMRSDLERSFWFYLNCPKTWPETLQLVEVEGIASAYWHKHPRIPEAPADFSRSAIDELAKALGDYFHVMEGHGRNCQIDKLEGETVTYLLCFLEDKSRAEPAWDGPVVVRQSSRRAVPLIYAYSASEGKLDTYIRGRSKSVHACQSLFAEKILGLKKLDPAPKDRSVYDLERFKRRGTKFVFDVGTGIDTIAVRKLRLTPRFGAKRHIVLEANPTGEVQPVYDILESELKDLDLSVYDVTQVELKAIFRAQLGLRRETIPFAITTPNRCSLRYDGRQLILRQVLMNSRIEPNEEGT